jgi:RHS repeat-associated protein
VEVQLKRFRYLGKERDEESGLYYYGARYYAPWLARFTSADPKGIDDGLNAFAYVRNNPIRLVDPDGRESMTFGRALEVLHANVKSSQTNDAKRLMYTNSYSNAALAILKVSEQKGVPPAKALILVAQALQEQALTIWKADKFKETGYRMFNMQVHQKETDEFKKTKTDWNLPGVSSTRLDSSEAADRSGGNVKNSPFFKFTTLEKSVGHFLGRLSGDDKYFLARETSEIKTLQKNYAAAHASLVDAGQGVAEYGAKLQAAGYAKDAKYAETLREKYGEVLHDFLGVIDKTLKDWQSAVNAMDNAQLERDIKDYSEAVAAFEAGSTDPGLLINAENVEQVKGMIRAWQAELKTNREVMSAYAKLKETKKQIEQILAPAK